MWESRPLPKIVRRPPCSSQREGVFFYALPPVGRRGASLWIVPGTSRGFFRFGGKACGEGNLFGKRFSLPVPHPSKNFYRWACARMESLRRGRAGCVIGQGRGITRPEAVAIGRRESASRGFVLKQIAQGEGIFPGISLLLGSMLSCFSGFSEILVDKRTRTGHFALRKILLMELDRCWRS